MFEDYNFVEGFRNSAPYIHAHRNKTFVICFGGEAFDENISTLIHDIALLKNLGIHLVLVHGVRPQIDSRLEQQNIQPVFKDNLRITDKASLECVKEAVGILRVEIEALLSMGLPSSPMAGAKIKVVSGNFVTAKPVGVIDGIDYCYTGLVRRIDSPAIYQQLKQDNIVLISPLGYSPSGEAFNLTVEHVATEVACALQAEKLILLTEQDLLSTKTAEVIPQMTSAETAIFLDNSPKINFNMARNVNAAIDACQQNVKRVHLVNRHHNGGLLAELFTRDGSGTLISSIPFENLRDANLTDIAGILELITPLEKQGKLIERSREKLETEINDYIVIERDGLIIACTAFHLLAKTDTAIVACLAVHPDYQHQARGKRLFNHLINKAKQQKLQQLFVLTTQTAHWFIEQGFLTTEAELLPKSLKSYYNPYRNSKVLYKSLS